MPASRARISRRGSDGSAAGWAWISWCFLDFGPVKEGALRCFPFFLGSSVFPCVAHSNGDVV